MNVNICYQTKGNEDKYKVVEKNMSIKEAEAYYKAKLKDNPEVVRVWLRYFGGYHYYTKKILKKKNAD